MIIAPISTIPAHIHIHISVFQVSTTNPTLTLLYDRLHIMYIHIVHSPYNSDAMEYHTTDISAQGSSHYILSQNCVYLYAKDNLQMSLLHALTIVKGVPRVMLLRISSHTERTNLPNYSIDYTVIYNLAR
jgi:hypothetical protein